jgi:hypothetical protein
MGLDCFESSLDIDRHHRHDHLLLLSAASPWPPPRLGLQPHIKGRFRGRGKVTRRRVKVVAGQQTNDVA